MALTSAQKGKARVLPLLAAGRDVSKAILSPHSSDSGSAPHLNASEDEDKEDSGSSLSAFQSDASDSESDSNSSTSSTYMKNLLEKARQNAREQKALAASPATDQEVEEELIQLDDESDAPKLPSLDPGSLPPAYIISSGSHKAAPPKVRDPEAEHTENISSKLSCPAAPPPPRNTRTKKQRKALKNKTAGPNWFDLPAPAEADLPRLHREVEALRLRNQLDPKRFYRKDGGEGKGTKGLPKHFAIGKIVETKSPFGGASGDNLARATRKRTLVDELVDDAEAKSYAKKKFRELQTARGARGRGTLAKKFAARKAKW